MSKDVTFGLGPIPEYPAPEWAKLAKRIEGLGFDTLWIPDERFYRDVSVILSVIASSTSELNIGTAVTDPFVRHPALTAQWTASIDELSNGRMKLGIGAGISGFTAMGVQRKLPALAIREMITLLRLLWSDTLVDYQGETVIFQDSSLDFKPLRDRIPVYIGGRGPIILKLAGEIAEGAILGSLASDQGLQYAFNQIDAGLKESGRTREEFDVAIWLHTAISEDREAAQNAVREIVVGALISSLPVLDRLSINLDMNLVAQLKELKYEHGSPDVIKVGKMLGDDILNQFSVTGNASEVAKRIQEINQAGVKHFALKPWLVPGQSIYQFAEQVAKEVMPFVTL